MRTFMKFRGFRKVIVTTVIIMGFSTISCGKVLEPSKQEHILPLPKSLHGFVFDTETGDPLPCVFVGVIDAEGNSTDVGWFTDLNGEYYLKNIPDEGVQVGVYLMGFKTIKWTPTSNNELESTRHDFFMQWLTIEQMLDNHRQRRMSQELFTIPPSR